MNGVSIPVIDSPILDSTRHTEKTGLFIEAIDMLKDTDRFRAPVRVEWNVPPFWVLLFGLLLCCLEKLICDTILLLFGMLESIDEQYHDEKHNCWQVRLGLSLAGLQVYVMFLSRRTPKNKHLTAPV